MPTWGEVLKELRAAEGRFNREVQDLQRRAQAGEDVSLVDIESPVDEVRRKYLAELYAYTGRATIIYYSGWMENKHPPDAISVQLLHVHGLMETSAGVAERKLDLLVHSPGGIPDAAESMMDYLRTQFEHIRVIVPHAAMSAATMMALSADEIVMGTHSQLGPIDPQFTVPTPEGPRSAPGQAIKDQFEMAKRECQNPANLNAWVPLLRGLVPGLLSMTEHARLQAEEIVKRALCNYMLSGEDDPTAAATAVAKWFSDFTYFRSHGRRVSRDDARDHGVKVADLEVDRELQDLVLTVHHVAMQTFASTTCAMIIENHQGKAWLRQTPGAQAIQLQLGPVAPAPPAPLPQGLPAPKKPPPPPRKKR